VFEDTKDVNQRSTDNTRVKRKQPPKN